MIERRFDPGSLIFSPETPVEQLYFLLSGVVRLYKTYGAYKESTVEMLKDRGAFGQFVPSNGRRVNGFAEAVTEVRAVGVRREEIMRLITRQPDFTPALFAVLLRTPTTVREYRPMRCRTTSAQSSPPPAKRRCSPANSAASFI